jgi:hypothetical protein
VSHLAPPGFSNLTSSFEQLEGSSIVDLGISYGDLDEATNGTSVLLLGALSNGSLAVISYSLSSRIWSVVQVAPGVYGGVAALADREYFLTTCLAPGTKCQLELYNGRAFTRLSGVISNQYQYLWELIGADANGNLFLLGTPYNQGGSPVTYELNPADGFRATNLTSRMPNGAVFQAMSSVGSTVALGGFAPHDLPHDGASYTPAYGVYNETTGRYHELNTTGSKLPANNTFEGIAGISAEGGTYFFGELTAYERFGNASLEIYSISSDLYSYDLATGALSNLSRGLPARANIEGMFVLPNFPGVALALERLSLNTTQSFSYNEYFVYNTSSRSLVNRTAQFGEGIDFDGVSETPTQALLEAYSASAESWGIELVDLTASAVKVSWVSVPAPPLAPTYWLGETVAGDGGFLTVGGNGFVFYADGRFASANYSGSAPGFLTGAAWDGAEFLLVGQYYAPGDGLLAYEYDPFDNALRNVTGEFPHSLSTEASLRSCVWNGTAFVIVGEADEASSVPVPLLFTLDPATNTVKNESSIPDKVRFNVDVSDSELATPVGVFVAGTGLKAAASTREYLGLLNGTTFTNLTSKVPLAFTGTPYWSIGGTLAWGSDRLLLAGNLADGSVDVLAYNASSNALINYASSFKNDAWPVSAVTFFDGSVWVGGSISPVGVFATDPTGQEAFLLSVSPGAGSSPTASVRNVSSDIPSGFYEIDTLANNATGLFVGGGLFGFSEFGFLIPAPLGEKALPSPTGVGTLAALPVIRRDAPRENHELSNM